MSHTALGINGKERKRIIKRKNNNGIKGEDKKAPRTRQNITPCHNPPKKAETKDQMNIRGKKFIQVKKTKL